MKKFDIVDHFRKALYDRKQKDADLVIDADKMANEIYMNADLSSLSREELEHRFISAYTRVLLAQNGYRSVVRGLGFFVDEKTTNPSVFAMLFKNQKNSRDWEESKLNEYKKYFKDVFPGQLTYNLETYELDPSPSLEDLIKMLEEAAI